MGADPARQSTPPAHPCHAAGTTPRPGAPPGHTMVCCTLRRSSCAAARISVSGSGASNGLAPRGFAPAPGYVPRMRRRRIVATRGEQPSSALATTESADQGADPPGVPRTRAGTLWAVVGVGLALLVVVLVFIFENLHAVRVSFFGAHWRAPLGLDLLLAAVLGGSVVLTFGIVRMAQLRLVARRHQRSRVVHGAAAYQDAPSASPTSTGTA